MNWFAAAWRDAARHERAAFSFVLAASFVSLLFSIAGYPAVGHDADVHLNWLDQFSRLRAQGIAYPRWLPISNGGFGSPTFYFYPPLPYWIASFLRLFLPYVPTPFYNVMALIATMGSLVTSAALARRYANRPLIIATVALTYSFLAYHFADVFVRDALGEHWAMMFLPQVFIRLHGRLQTIALLSIAWSGLVLTNIPITVLAGASVLVALIVERRKASVIEHGVALLIAAAVSAAYLLPAAFLRPLIHPEHLWDVKMQTTGFAVLDLFRFHGWLRFLALATLVAGALYLLLAWRDRLRQGAWWWIALIAVVVQIPIFTPLWHLHAASIVQFSWRWNSVLLLALAMAFAVRASIVLSWLLVGLAIVTVIGEARLATTFIVHPLLPYDRYRIDAPEYHPVWCSNDPGEIKAIAMFRIGDPPAMLLGLTPTEDSIVRIAQDADAMTFHVHLTQPAPARFHLFYWPYWKLTIWDSVAGRGPNVASLQPDPNGIATASLPAGDYRLDLSLVESEPEVVGKYISLIGLMGLIGMIGFAAYRERTICLDTIEVPIVSRAT
ncbi:MAG: hypothetical protein Q8922_08835 [Bacteroidota bacterium]|nr:hypothetical protein [Bacteroidota bacterium]MDP4234409.1 hypothetical protein [Bacteroidota bacterium]MDP4243341.1 hypothetical protein [Bacteroidota bacterium]MDP4288027.1 hypothetical protein [Bacteroidota bacterium]